jgi:hypothetical protein
VIYLTDWSPRVGAYCNVIGASFTNCRLRF